jgi:hypothetical protein
MITEGLEYYSSPYYFFLKNKGKDYSLYIAVENTISEAKNNDVMVKVPKDKVEAVKRYINKVTKKKSPKKTSDVKKEIEELVDSDGVMSLSKIPILDPALHPKKTMDQTVAASRITNDPIARGYRTYYGESVEVDEVDLSKAFGYEETSGKTPEDTIKILKDMGVDNAKERANEFGKTVKINKGKKPGSKMRLRLVEKQRIEELRKQKVFKMLEDILMKSKDSVSSDVNKKEITVSKILKKNLKSLKRQAEREGISISSLVKLLKSE